MLARSIYRSFGKLDWATVNPRTLSGANPGQMMNLVGGQWKNSSHSIDIVDPMNGEKFLRCPDTQTDAELNEFRNSLKQCTKSGLHNPLKNPERYLKYGDVMFRAAELMRNKEVEDFFTECVQRVMPKSDGQARGEVVVTRKFLENMTGDNVRFMMKGFNVPGDHAGQMSQGFRWPFGPVVCITPFNFPFEIPVLQVMGA